MYSDAEHGETFCGEDRGSGVEPFASDLHRVTCSPCLAALSDLGVAATFRLMEMLKEAGLE